MQRKASQIRSQESYIGQYYCAGSALQELSSCNNTLPFLFKSLTMILTNFVETCLLCTNHHQPHIPAQRRRTASLHTNKFRHMATSRTPLPTTASSPRRGSMILFFSFSSFFRSVCSTRFCIHLTTTAPWIRRSLRHNNQLVDLRWWSGRGTGKAGRKDRQCNHPQLVRAVIHPGNALTFSRSTAYLLLLITAAAVLLSVGYLLLTRMFTKIIMHITLVLTIVLNMSVSASFLDLFLTRVQWNLHILLDYQVLL